MFVTATETQTKTGVGFSQNENSFEAGVEIARMAVKGKELNEKTLFLLFATPHHKIEKLIEGIQYVTGTVVDILGCTTTGIVTNDFISYSSTMAGGAFLSSSKSFYQFFVEEDIRNREFEAGKNLALQIKKKETKKEAPILFFYDSIKKTSAEGNPELNLATPILQGFYNAFGTWPTMAGLGSLGDINLNYPCEVWVNKKHSRQMLAATTISGDLKMDTVIMHGTRPASGYHTITKASNNIIYEIDGQPALDVIDGILGGTVPWEEFPLLVTLGVNNGDKFIDFKEENYASRLCFSIDKEKKALMMFENDLVDGTEVQLMNRNIDFKYIQPQVNKLLEKLGNRRPVFAFYIDCLGRTSGYSGIAEEESLEVIKALGNIPFFGLFSGVEIANVADKVKALDWSGVLCLFSEERI